MPCQRAHHRPREAQRAAMLAACSKDELVTTEATKVVIMNIAIQVVIVKVSSTSTIFFFFFFEPIYIPEYKPETRTGLYLGANTS
jgi:hypothetical protein